MGRGRGKLWERARGYCNLPNDMDVSGRAHVIVKSKINVETTTMLVRKLTEGGATSKTTTTTSTKSRFGDITPSTVEKRNQ
uniref:Uncharacterized protein n=1 Tax=Gossypium raimondii TaxID=29730 RepID=A0A0D2TN73_GOSRA|nr:hypothetical protein B456_009G204800 [Gossypium raimondii]